MSDDGETQPARSTGLESMTPEQYVVTERINEVLAGLETFEEFLGASHPHTCAADFLVAHWNKLLPQDVRDQFSGDRAPSSVDARHAMQLWARAAGVDEVWVTRTLADAYLEAHGMQKPTAGKESMTPEQYVVTERINEVLAGLETLEKFLKASYPHTCAADFLVTHWNKLLPQHIRDQFPADRAPSSVDARHAMQLWARAAGVDEAWVTRTLADAYLEAHGMQKPTARKEDRGGSPYPPFVRLGDLSAYREWLARVTPGQWVLSAIAACVVVVVIATGVLVGGGHSGASDNASNSIQRWCPDWQWVDSAAGLYKWTFDNTPHPVPQRVIDAGIAYGGALRFNYERLVSSGSMPADLDMMELRNFLLSVSAAEASGTDPMTYADNVVATCNGQ